MKIYEKPMASIEMIEVNDVIASSDPVTIDGEMQSALESAGVNPTDTIIFEW